MLAPNKRVRLDDNSQLMLYTSNLEEESSKPLRTSALSSPTMKLTGHGGSVYQIQFSKSGNILASGSFDKTVFLWDTSFSTDSSSSSYSTTNLLQNYNVLTGHKNAVLDLKFMFDDEHLVTASADRSCGYFDVLTGERMGSYKHDKIVNAVDCCSSSSTATSTSNNSNKLFASVSDDCTAKIWDTRIKKKYQTNIEHEFQLTSVAFAEDHVYTGGIDNIITRFDIRNPTKPDLVLMGCNDTLTCLTLSSCSQFLLSNSMDGTVRKWDVRPYCQGPRLSKSFVGSKHSINKGLLKCSFSPDGGSMVSSGSTDNIVHIWDELTTEELYFLPGHSGSVNAVEFHPTNNIVASASSDKTILIGELSNTA